MASLGKLVDDVRWQGFVGRTTEVAGFDDALAGRSSHRVLFVHGPGGQAETPIVIHIRPRAAPGTVRTATGKVLTRAHPGAAVPEQAMVRHPQRRCLVHGQPEPEWSGTGQRCSAGRFTQ